MDLQTPGSGFNPDPQCPNLALKATEERKKIYKLYGKTLFFFLLIKGRLLERILIRNVRLW